MSTILHRALILCFGLSVAAQASVKTGFQFTTGITSVPLNSVTTSPTAKKDFLGEFYNPLGFKYNFESFSSYQLSANLSTTKLSLISNKDKDNGLSTYLTQLGVDVLFSSSSNVYFKSQLGILAYEMKGAGGTKELANGTGTTTFDLPNRTVNSQMIFMGLGSQIDFGSGNLEMNFNIVSPFSSTRRSYLLSLMFGVPL